MSKNKTNKAASSDFDKARPVDRDPTDSPEANPSADESTSGRVWSVILTGILWLGWIVFLGYIVWGMQAGA